MALKHTFLILVFCWSKLFSQVGPVDLRCIEVLPNGNVKLTWIPPSDPSNSFFAYEVYASSSQFGGYSQFGPQITSITTNTFIHTTTVSIAQSLYYYVKALSGPGGANAASSQTLQSMHLNIFSTLGAVDLKIQYNDLHQPRLPSSSPTYSITKEYPIGTVNTLAVVGDEKYADTISVCNADINYQVRLADNSGCVSTSNIIFGTYTDTYRPGGPNGPYVDSISVLPDGSTTIAWHTPRDMDIIKYQIYSRGTSTAIITPTAIVPGRLSTSFTLTGTSANNQPVALYVAAIDSCSEDAGVYNISPVTIFLRSKYNECSFTTDLWWNKYQGMPDGILEYRIYYSANGTDFSLVGNTKDTAFVHPGAAPGKNVCYFVRVINNPKTITASSNRSCFFTTQIEASDFVYIRSASVSDKNIFIKLFADTAKNCQGFDLLRADDGVQFNNIGFLPFIPNQPHYSFTDENASPSKQSYVYKAVVKDGCGNPRAASNSAKTIFLKVQDDQDNIFTKHLSWNAYEGFSGGVNRYTIYRVINDVTNSEPVTSVGSATGLFTDDIEDEAPAGAKVEYLVQAIEGSGNPYGIFEISNSNTAAVYMEGHIFIPTAFAPNGKNKTWKPVTHFIDKTDYSVNIFNRWGHEVFKTNRDDEGWDGANNPPDVYVYLVRYKNSLGEYKEVKGTLLLLE